MDAPTIPVSAEENLGDPIDIRVDIIHPEPVAAIAFPAAAVVRIQTQHGEAIRGIQEHLLGVAMQEELTALRFREKRARIAIERQFGFQLEFTATGLRELQEAPGVIMTIGLDLPKQILNAQTGAQKLENLKHEDVGVARFGKRGKLNPRYVGPSKVLEKVGTIPYKLEMPQELSRVLHTFHVSNLKKCYSDDPLVFLLEGVYVDDKLHFVEEPIEIMDREVKRLRQSRVLIFKVRWNSKRGPEFTWEHEDQFRKKYPHLFAKAAPSSSAAS
ncbi:hypothetical protein Tco_1541366 [Tanacetum coccineum]